MINSTAVLEQEIKANDSVIFDTDQIRTRSSKCPKRGWLIHKKHSDTFSIDKNGIYKIYYNANISSCKCEDIFLELLIDGEVIDGSKGIFKAKEYNSYGNISATVLISVQLACPYDKKDITLSNTSGKNIKVKDANIIIDRVG